MELATKTRSEIIEQFRKNAKDTGSVEVQVALLTKDINYLNAHCLEHPKDYSTKRGLLRMVNQRRRHLIYLKKNDVQQYRMVIEKLGLRK
jgi:small subunit ribosomal protein S15